MPAVFHHERALVRDDLLEAHTPLADDASLVVQDDRRAEIDRFRFREFRLGKPRGSLAVRHRKILQIAFAALIADGTIKGMVEQ